MAFAKEESKTETRRNTEKVPKKQQQNIGQTAVNSKPS